VNIRENYLSTTYSLGDLNGTEFLAEALYDDNMEQFLTGWFPEWFRFIF
jgi:hypothetical protein